MKSSNIEAPPKLSPKDFAPHLLHVLAELSGGKANVAVAMKNTFLPICKRLSLEEKAGGRTSHGSLWTHRQIGFAMKLLRHSGHTEYQSRGNWMLTDPGLRVATRETGTTKKATRAPKPVVSDGSAPEATIIFFRSPVSESVYDQDAYLRKLAIQQTSCWGHHSPQDTACRRCLLAASCSTQLKETLVVIASRLTLEEISPAGADKRRKSAAIQELEESVAPDSTDEILARINAPRAKARIGSKERPSKMPAKPGTVCAHCRNEIPVGVTVIWVRSRGYFHEDCVETP